MSIILDGTTGVTAPALNSAGSLILESNFSATERKIALANAEFSPLNAHDNALDLGKTSGRWKDLYLSGGVYVGGTAAANHLDDYEEGTWTTTFNAPANLTGTPTLSGATYTKIGRLVTITGQINGYSVTSSNTVAYPVFHLPFPMVGGNLSPLSGVGVASVGSVWVCGAFVDNSSGEATSVALIFPAVGVTTTGTASINFTLVYQTTT
jgi:hypothetical protein